MPAKKADTKKPAKPKPATKKAASADPSDPEHILALLDRWDALQRAYRSGASDNPNPMPPDFADLCSRLDDSLLVVATTTPTTITRFVEDPTPIDGTTCNIPHPRTFRDYAEKCIPVYDVEGDMDRALVIGHPPQICRATSPLERIRDTAKSTAKRMRIWAETQPYIETVDKWVKTAYGAMGDVPPIEDPLLSVFVGVEIAAEDRKLCTFPRYPRDLDMDLHNQYSIGTGLEVAYQFLTDIPVEENSKVHEWIDDCGENIELARDKFPCAAKRIEKLLGQGTGIRAALESVDEELAAWGAEHRSNLEAAGRKLKRLYNLRRAAGESVPATPTASPPPPPESDQIPVMDLLDGGKLYRISFQGQVQTFRALKGAKILAQLLDNPGEAMDAWRLMRTLNPTGTEKVEMGARDPVCDQESIRAVQKRIQELKDCMEQESSLSELEELAEELSKCEEFLRKNTGLNGRARMTADDKGRAVDGVRKNLYNFLEKHVKDTFPELFDHLDKAIGMNSGNLTYRKG